MGIHICVVKLFSDVGAVGYRGYITTVLHCSYNEIARLKTIAFHSLTAVQLQFAMLHHL